MYGETTICPFIKNWIYPLGIILLGFTYYITYLNYGISLSDEGFFVYGAERVLQGQLPMSDFISYLPGNYFLLALLYKIFGLNLLAFSGEKRCLTLQSTI